MLPLFNNRTAVQVKTHGQVILRRMEQGENVFDELDRFERYIQSKRAISDDAGVTAKELVYAGTSNLKPEDIEAANTLFVMRKVA